MNPRVKLLNDDDRHAYAWLQAYGGLTRVTGAAGQLAQTGRPVFVSALCRHLGMWPPARPHAIEPRERNAIADDHLARIRRILATRNGPGGTAPLAHS